MTQRPTWKFEYAVSTILLGAKRQRDYHASKVAEWREKELQREEEMRKSITMGESYEQVAGKTTVVAVPAYDETKRRELAEAQSHRKNHQNQEADYIRWIGVLAVQRPDVLLSLDFDDILYFDLDAH